MSLDVSLVAEAPFLKSGTGVFIRENGKTTELSMDEVEARWPGYMGGVNEYKTDELYSANITHNLNKMAKAAGIYEHLWRPDEIGVEIAHQLIEPLTIGLGKLMSDPEYYRTYNPENSWGDYDGLCEFVFNYIKACQKYPDAKVEVSI